MKTVIVDSALKGFGGHNYTYTSVVRSAIQRLGNDVVVLANKNLPPNLASDGFQRAFSLGAFDFPASRGRWRDMRYVLAQSRIYADELEAALDGISLDPKDLIFCHTVADFELIAWNRYLRRRHLAASLVILLRHTESFKRCAPLRRWLHPYWRLRPHYLNAIHRRMRGRFALATDSELLSDDYRIVFHHQIITLPVPVPFGAHGSSGSGFPDHPLCVGYVGDARLSKGLDLLPRVVERFLERGDDRVKFAIQSSVGAGASIPRAVHELHALHDKYPARFDLITEHMSGLQYEEFVRSLDVIVLPYADLKYRESTSGIFAEALTLGTPVLVTHDTWMADQLRRSGGGLEFRRNDAADMAQQLERLVSEYPVFRARALAYAGEWQRLHNPDRLAALLLAFSHQ